MGAGTGVGASGVIKFSMLLGADPGAQAASRKAIKKRFKKHRVWLFPLRFRESVKVVLSNLSTPSLPCGLFIIFAQDHSLWLSI